MFDDGIKRKISKIVKREGFERIQISVKDGIVHLNGTVNSWGNFLKLGHLVGKIKNVEGVVNNLTYPGKLERKVKREAGNEKIGKTDVIIIGGGVVGCSILRELSKYKLNIILLEKKDDVACGATKANNAMIHTGIGENNGTLKQKLCVKGHQIFGEIATELNVPYKKSGMWIILTKDSLAKMKIPFFIANFISKRILPKIILRRGKKLGIPIKFVKRGELLEEEPNLTDRVLAAVYSPTYGVTSPYLFTIALAENAIENGAEILLNSEVVDITIKDGKIHSVITTKGIIDTNIVINAAGLYADDIAEMAGTQEYTIHPKKGATLLFDKEIGNYINHSMSLIQLPRLEHYKGGGVMLTVDGNIQWGPTITEIQDKECTSVTSNELEKILEQYALLLPDFPKKLNITYFSGLRASTFTEDFIIRPSGKVKGFIHVAGIQSPGLAAAPAIAEMVRDILIDEGFSMDENEKFNPYREKHIPFSDLAMEEKKKLIEKNPHYGRIVCRCEKITEGEIIDAINSKIPVSSMDAIKRRTRAGMGRCQGGFCLPNIAEIISRETGIPMEKILKNEEGSNLFVGKAKCLLERKNVNN